MLVSGQDREFDTPVITLDQSQIDAMIAYTESDAHPDNLAPLDIYQTLGNDPIELVVDGEIDGYLHIVTETEVFTGSDFEETTYYTSVVWSPTAELPEGGEGTVDLLRFENGTETESFYDSYVEYSPVTEFTFAEERFETIDLPEDLGLDGWYLPLGDNFIPSTTISEHSYEANTPSVTIDSDTTLAFDQSQLDALIDEPDGAYDVVTYEVTETATVTLDMPDNADGYYHLIFTDQGELDTDVEGEAFIVHSASPEAPAFITGVSNTNPQYYFYDENGQPDDSYDGVLVIEFASDGVTSDVGALAYDPSDFASVTDRVYPTAPFNTPI